VSAASDRTASQRTPGDELCQIHVAIEITEQSNAKAIGGEMLGELTPVCGVADVLGIGVERNEAASLRTGLYNPVVVGGGGQMHAIDALLGFAEFARGAEGHLRDQRLEDALDSDVAAPGGFVGEHQQSIQLLNWLVSSCCVVRCLKWGPSRLPRVVTISCLRDHAGSALCRWARWGEQVSIDVAAAHLANVPEERGADLLASGRRRKDEICEKKRPCWLEWLAVRGPSRFVY